MFTDRRQRARRDDEELIKSERRLGNEKERKKKKTNRFLGQEDIYLCKTGKEMCEAPEFQINKIN